MPLTSGPWLWMRRGQLTRYEGVEHCGGRQLQALACLLAAHVMLKVLGLLHASLLPSALMAAALNV